MCKFAITRKNNAFVANIVNRRLTKVFMVIFALAEMLPTSAILVTKDVFGLKGFLHWEPESQGGAVTGNLLCMSTQFHYFLFPFLTFYETNYRKFKSYP